MKTQVTVQQEQKSTEINWGVPQLVISKGNNHIVQTNGDHKSEVFTGMTMQVGDTANTIFSIDENWAKELFTPFYGSITITNTND